MKARLKKIFGRNKNQSKSNSGGISSSSRSEKREYPVAEVVIESDTSDRKATDLVASSSSSSTTASGLRIGGHRQQREQEGVAAASKDFTLTSESACSAGEVEPVTSGVAVPDHPDKPTAKPSESNTMPEEEEVAAPTGSQNPEQEGANRITSKVKEADAPHVVLSYDAVPVLEQTKLPRGGVSVDTKAVGRVQVRSSRNSYTITMVIIYMARHL